MLLFQSVEGMKVVCHELAQSSNDPEGSAMDDLVRDADKLVSCLAKKASIITISFDYTCFPLCCCLL